MILPMTTKSGSRPSSACVPSNGVAERLHLVENEQAPDCMGTVLDRAQEAGRAGITPPLPRKGSDEDGRHRGVDRGASPGQSRCRGRLADLLLALEELRDAPVIAAVEDHDPPAAGRRASYPHRQQAGLGP